MPFAPYSPDSADQPSPAAGNTPAAFGPTIVERKPFGPTVTEGLRLRPAAPDLRAATSASPATRR